MPSSKRRTAPLRPRRRRSRASVRMGPRSARPRCRRVRTRFASLSRLASIDQSWRVASAGFTMTRSVNAGSSPTTSTWTMIAAPATTANGFHFVVRAHHTAAKAAAMVTSAQTTRPGLVMYISVQPGPSKAPVRVVAIDGRATITSSSACTPSNAAANIATWATATRDDRCEPHGDRNAPEAMWASTDMARVKRSSWRRNELALSRKGSRNRWKPRSPPATGVDTPRSPPWRNSNHDCHWPAAATPIR